MISETVEKASPLSNLSDEYVSSLRDLAKRDLYVFAKGVLGFDWLVPHIHMPLCRILEKHSVNTRVQITLPRGWLKTTLCSQAYPIWRAINNPEVRVLLAQNTFTNAVSKLRTIKDTFEKNDLFRGLFPELMPRKGGVWRADSLCVNRKKAFPESTFEAAGTRTQVTSRHYDLIIEDDTVAPELDDLGEKNLCPTKDDIDQAIGWHRLVTPLLVNPIESQNLVVGTRWFEKDLISWIQDNEKYKFYERAVLENDEGKPDVKGDIAYPERFSYDVLDGLKASLGPYLFSCLYMNRPLRSDDMVFQEEWFLTYDTEPKALLCYTTIDPAGDPEDTKGDPDYNVVMTCGKDMYSGRIYVLSYWRAKCSPGELIEKIFEHVRIFHPVKVGLETVAYQKSLKYWIREKMKKDGKWFQVESLTHVKRSKNSRIIGLQPLFANSMIMMRPFMTALKNELLSFPLGKNDDLIDALASQLELWALTSSQVQDQRKRDKVDPLSFDVAIKEIQQRYKSKGPLVYDVFNRPNRISSLVFN